MQLRYLKHAVSVIPHGSDSLQKACRVNRHLQLVSSKSYAGFINKISSGINTSILVKQAGHRQAKIRGVLVMGSGLAPFGVLPSGLILVSAFDPFVGFTAVDHCMS